MPFYFIAGFKKPAARRDVPQEIVKHNTITYAVDYGVYHFIPPNTEHVNAHLTRAAKSGYQIECYDEYVTKSREIIEAAQRIRSQVELTQIQRDQGRVVPLNAELPALRVGMIKSVQQKQLDERHELLKPFINEGVKLQKTAIWRQRLSAILEGKEDVRKNEFMELFSEIWGETPALIILMQEVYEHFQLNARSVNELASNFQSAFTNIKFLPQSYQDQVAEYILAELITKITALVISHPQEAQKLLNETKGYVPEKLQPVIIQFTETLSAYSTLLEDKGDNEETLQNKLNQFCDKATCYSTGHAVGEAGTHRSDILIPLVLSSHELFKHVQKRKIHSGKLATILQRSQNRLDLSNHVNTDALITTLLNHYRILLAQNISDPQKTAIVIAAAEQSFQSIRSRLIDRKNQRRRQGGENLEQDINYYDGLIEKANLAQDNMREIQFLADFLR